MSMLPSDTPRLPKWPFLVGDAALLGTAALIATRSLDPWSGAPLIASVSCVALGTGRALEDIKRLRHVLSSMY